MVITKEKLRELINEVIAKSSRPAETSNAAGIAKIEAEWWDGPVIDKRTKKPRRRHEKDYDSAPEVKDRLNKYWKQSHSSFTGYKKPWSAAFISHAFKDDPDFTGSKVHVDYMKGAAMNRFLWDKEQETSSMSRKGKDRPDRPDKVYNGYVAFKPDEYNPDIGDIVCNPRGKGGYLSFDPSSEKVSIGSSNHCDVCLDANCQTVTGGNIGGDVCKDFKSRGLSDDDGCTSRVKPKGDYKMIITKNPERVQPINETEKIVSREQLRKLIKSHLKLQS